MFDVIIVGAGPAGASTAFYLAKAGLKVLLLEKNKLPRFKPCGGGISLNFLNSLPFDVSSSITGKVEKVRYYYNFGNAVEVELGVKMAMVNRSQFDCLIAQQAVKAGAKLVEQAKVNAIDIQKTIVVYTERDKYETRFLVGADGVHSQTGKWSGLIKKRKIRSSLEAEVIKAEINPITALIGFGQLTEGYCWLFPKSDFHSIGIGGKESKNLVKEFKRWAEFLRIKSDFKIYAYPLPEVEIGQKLEEGHVLLVGDAAGLVDPLTGEGIRSAIRSAQIAAETILNDKVGNYSSQIEREISADYRYCNILKAIFFKWPKFSYQRAVMNPGVSQWIARIFCGEVSYQEIYRKAIRKLLNPMTFYSFLRGSNQIGKPPQL